MLSPFFRRTLTVTVAMYFLIHSTPLKIYNKKTKGPEARFVRYVSVI